MAAPPIAERHLPHFHRRAPFKESCRAATTANITIATALNNGDTLDGVTLATGDRVLVKNQSTGSQNGIYEVGASPARAYDLSTDDPSFGFLVYVREGTTNASTLWENTNTSTPTIDTTSLTFSQITTTAPSGTYVLTIEGGQDTIKAHGSMGSTETIDPTDGNVHTGTLNAACTITLNAPVGSGASTLELYFTQDGTGGWAVTWPGSVTFPSGTTVDTTASTTTRYVLETLDGGTTWYGNVVGSGSSLTVKDEGSPLATAATSLDFVGAGVTASGTGAAKTITIAGATTHYEILMASGSADPLLTSDGLDYLYVEVPN